MKRFLLTILRTLFNSLCIVSVCIAVFMFFNTIGKMSLLTSIMFYIIPMILGLVLHYFASRVPFIDSKELCRAEFKDVASISKKGIIFIGIAYVLMLLLFTISSHVKTLSYSRLYPDADELFRTEFAASEETLALYKSLPAFVTEKAYISAQCISNALEEYEDTSDEELDANIESIYNDMTAKHRNITVSNVFRIFFLLASGFLLTISRRCQQYHTLMRKLEE